jgi:hypothetical protein
MAASIVPILAKLAIPAGVGLLLLASRKGKDEAATKAVTLTKRAVEAMQKANASMLEDAAEDFRDDDADPITAGLLDFQKARMVARGTRGFTDAPTFDNDKGLAIDNREVVPRLVQLEGRAKALDAWAEAYSSIGAKETAKLLRTKAKALRGETDPKDKAAADKKAADKKAADKKADEKAKSKGEGAAKPDLTDVVKQVTDALASGSVSVMRKVAADLRAQGFNEQADSLDAAANELEAEQKAKAKDEGKPAPDPTPEPKTHRKVEVTSKLNSESAITKSLLGKADRMRELVAVNIPLDADGRARQKVTAALIAQKGINPNRLGGLFPGLQPGQHLFVPDDWPLKPTDTKPAKPDVVKPKPSSGGKPATGDALTTQLITMLVGKSPGQEDSFMVKKWQSANSRVSDGKYGPGDALFMADTLGVVPPSPLYWPKSNTQKALTNWHQEMSRLAIERPGDADAFRFADKAGFQPGFEGFPSNKRIVSRRFGDGLGSLLQPSVSTVPSKPSSTTNVSTSSQPKTSRPTIRKGSSGSDVKFMQQRLSISPADGLFGPGTEKAVKNFQTANRLTADGIVGPNTWAVIEGRVV